MISETVTQHLKKSLGTKFRFYCLFYNLLAVVTLIPVALFSHSIQTQPLFTWTGYGRMVPASLTMLAGLLFFLGGRHYSVLQLWGIRQLREAASSQGLTSAGGLATSGILGIIRHPWYLAAILLIWTRSLDVSTMVVNLILTGYLVVGAYLEEQKLVREFGQAYLAYQKRVSMFIPFKWLRAKMSR